MAFSKWIVRIVARGKIDCRRKMPGGSGEARFDKRIDGWCLARLLYPCNLIAFVVEIAMS